MAKILFIDPGFKRMGFSLFRDENLLDHGTIGIERNENEAWTAYVSRGVLFFYAALNQYIYENHLSLNPIDKIVIEQLPPVSSSPSFNASAQITLVFCAISALIIVANEERVPIEYVAAQHWRKVFMKEPKATKAQIRRKVLELFPDIKGDKLIGQIPFDQTDAIAIGWAYLNDNNE